MFHSVRARLTLWYTVVVAVVLVAFSAVTYELLSRAIRSSTDASIIATGREFAAASSKRPAIAVAGDFRYTDRAILVVSPAGRIVASSPLQFTPEEQRRITSVSRHGGSGLTTVDGGEENDGIRVFRMPIEIAGRQLVVMVAADLDPQADRLEAAAHALMLGIPLALIVAAGGGYLMARKSLAPVTAMSRQARQISAETLDDRIAIRNERDELGHLGTTLNELLERLQRAFESQRGFMADASHELRTPISIILGEADVALSRPERPPADYRDSIRIIRKAALKLTRIVENLFLLARTDAGRYPMIRTLFYADELVAECARSMRSVAAARAIEVEWHAEPELLVDADKELLQHLLFNLIDNAVKFTPDGGRVTVAASRGAGNRYEIRVSDSGSGIPPNDQPYLFERFYRGPHADRSSGAGLGLAISRWIAEAHGGALVLERSDLTGSTFRVTLPAPEAAQEPVAHGAGNE